MAEIPSVLRWVFLRASRWRTQLKTASAAFLILDTTVSNPLLKDTVKLQVILAERELLSTGGLALQ
ncbi:MAG: hypothetical protein ACI9W1_003227 [Candidatus Azotimanducaceae bacterium]|jgi:hypothetical protein